MTKAELDCRFLGGPQAEGRLGDFQLALELTVPKKTHEQDDKVTPFT